jgi:hypothetical protein
MIGFGHPLMCATNLRLSSEEACHNPHSRN